VIRVFVVSGVALYREGIAAVLAARDGIEVIGVAADPGQVVEAIRSEPQPTVVVLDMATPDGVAAGRRLADTPGVRVLAITVPNREGAVIECAETGVTGFLTTDASVDELTAAVQRIARGELPCPPWTAGMLLRRVATLAHDRRRPGPASVLTSRELEIANLVERGLSNKQIAERLCIELPTVKNHMHHILDKLGVRRRAEAAAVVRSGGVNPMGGEY
jgi:two-component system nitrate/nitrite response regulator NarL